LTGRANFGFVAKYHHGATVPDGQTEFQFKAGNLNFHSTAYEWLVVAGARAQYKGSGTINGAGTYGFMLTAIDGQLPGGGGQDKFSIKIWDKNNDNALVYDNQRGATDGADPTRPFLAVARARWVAAGGDAVALSRVDVRVADLDDRALGLKAGSTIWVDRDAAGWGWFVDRTPGDDREFITPGDQGEPGRMDLLTVLMHEFGHVLGHEHEADGLMAETLDPAVRMNPDDDRRDAEPGPSGPRPAGAAERNDRINRFGLLSAWDPIKDIWAPDDQSIAEQAADPRAGAGSTEPDGEAPRGTGGADPSDPPTGAGGRDWFADVAGLPSLADLEEGDLILEID
jgi:Matrixin